MPKPIFQKIYTTEDGLSSNLVNSMQKDSKGFLWLTAGGQIFRFDGEDFKKIPEDFGLNEQHIRFFFEVENNRFLFAGAHGINLLDGINVYMFDLEQKTVVPYETDKKITFLAQGANKETYYGTEKGEIYKILNFEEEEFVFKLPENVSIQEMYPTPEGLFWVLSEEPRLYLIDKGFQILREFDFYPHSGIFGLKGENLYIFQQKDKGAKAQIELLKADLSIAQVLVEDAVPNDAGTMSGCYYLPLSKVLIQTDMEYGKPGLVTKERSPLQYFFYAQPDGNDYVMSTKTLVEQGEEEVWAGTELGLVYLKLKNSLFTNYLQNTEGLNYSMRGMAELNDSLLFFNSYAGVFLYNLNQKKIVRDLTEPDFLSGLGALKASDGCVYGLGEKTKILRLCDEDGAVEFLKYENNAITDKAHWSISEDESGRIWLGTATGLSFLDKEAGVIKSFDAYNDYSELSQSIVFSLSSQGEKLWIGSENGLYLLEKGKGITHRWDSNHPAPHYLPIGAVYDIYADSTGFVYLATSGSGLIELEVSTGNFKQKTVEEGLPSNVINCIEVDENGIMWLSTNYGIVRYDRDNETFLEFDNRDGAGQTEYNKQSSLAMRDGRLLFGGLSGISSFYPAELEEQLSSKINKSPLQFTSVKTDKEEYFHIESGDTLSFDNKKVDITLSFRQLELPAVHKKNYAWRFKEKGGRFQKISGNVIYLNELPEGCHTLQIKALDKSGIKSADTLELYFYYPKSYFASLCVLLLVVLVIAILLFLKIRKTKTEVGESLVEETLTDETLIDLTEEIVAKSEETESDVAVEPETPAPLVLKPADKVWLENLESTVFGSPAQEQVSVSELAVLMNLSQRQLNRKMKRICGKTPNHYLRDLKLEKAKKLLESGEVRTVAEVSYAVGFEKPHYFSQLFYRRYGKKPSEYF